MIEVRSVYKYFSVAHSVFTLISIIVVNRGVLHNSLPSLNLKTSRIAISDDNKSVFSEGL